MLAGALWDRVMSAKKETAKEDTTMRGRDIWQRDLRDTPTEVRRSYHRVHPGRGEVDKQDDTVTRGVNSSHLQDHTVNIPK